MYDEQYWKEEYGLDRLVRWLNHKLATILIRQIHTQKLALLDVGCGRGLFLEALEGKVAISLVGIDISLYALNEAKNRSTTDIIRASALDLPLRKDIFHMVTCFDVLEHLDIPLRAISEAHRVLTRGGIYCITTPNASLRKALMAFRIVKVIPSHKCEMSTLEVKALLENSGFRILKLLCCIRGLAGWFTGRLPPFIDRILTNSLLLWLRIPLGPCIFVIAKKE